MKWFILGSVLLCSLCSAAQQIPITTEQQLENLSTVTETETEDDSYLQQLDYYRKHPVNINDVSAEELQVFKMLTQLQIFNFIQYRNRMGDFIDIYELQSVPTWDVITIRKILPYLSLSASGETLLSRFTGGDHSLLVRGSRILEKQKGFDTSLSTHYLGDPNHLMFRYRYQYKNLLQYGVVAEKDAGEQFFKGSENKGFDFYSFHFFARNVGLVKALAIGDFTVNMGQGLVQWQSLAFKKSAEVLGIERQSPILMPYRSAGEFYFNRGVGVTLGTGDVSLTVFGSYRKVAASTGIDTLTNEEVFSSFLTSGLYRTPTEISNKNKIVESSFGGNLTYQTNRIKIGVNGVGYQFTSPLQKRNEAYNNFAINTDNWWNASTDYSYTYKNLHFFGEAAVDKRISKAFLNGMLISVDPKVDVSLLYRHIDQDYQSLYGNAFTENVLPTNENGFYTGISIRPNDVLRFDTYADFYRFPFLKYRTDAPSQGQDYLVQATYQPNRQFELYLRYRSENKEINESNTTGTTHYLAGKPKQDARIQFSDKISPLVTIRGRAEAVWYDRRGTTPEEGFLTYIEGSYKPSRSLSTNLRLQYFETGGFNSRIYVFESDVLYSYSIPFFSDKGYRYYVNINYDATKKLSLWLRWAQTIYKDQHVIGSGLDEIAGNKRTEVKIQARYLF